MFLDKDCAGMMHVLKSTYKKKLNEWKSDFGNRRLAVETCFIRNIYNDIAFLIRIPLNAKNERYFYLILRNCFEHAIIFRFLEEKGKSNPDIFSDYMGDNVDFDAISKEQDELEALKKLGGERTTKYKNKFIEMANGAKCIEGDTSLYRYYRMLADYCHNSYFHSIKSTILKEKKCDKEMILTSILVLLTEFYAGLEEE